MGIKTKLIMMFVILITIPLVALGTFSYIKSVNILEENLKTSSLQFVKQTEDSINNFLSGYEKGIMYMANDPNVQQVLSHPDSAQWMINSFRGYIKSHGEVKNIYLGTKSKDMF